MSLFSFWDVVDIFYVYRYHHEKERMTLDYILFVKWTQKLPTKWYLFRKGNDFLLFKLIFNLDSCL